MMDSGTLRQYTRGSVYPKTNNHLIKLKGHDVNLQLEVPDYNIHSDPVELSVYKNKHEDTKHLSKTLRAHVEFRLAILPELEQHHGVQLQRSIASVSSISLLFPDIRHESLTIYMAAWLETLCVVDDRLEEMSLKDAGDAIEEAIVVLRDEPIHTPKQIPIIQTVTNFKHHCRKNHPTFFSEICTAFTGLLREIHLKNGTLPQTLDTYLSVRCKTIDIKPVFTLIRSAYNNSYPFDEETNAKSVWSWVFRMI